MASRSVTRLEMTPDRLVRLIETTLGLTGADLAQMTNSHPRTVERWSAGESYPQREAQLRLLRLLDLSHRLQDTLTTPAAILAWLQHEQRYLAGSKPIDLIRKRHFDRVEAALEALDSGIFL